MDVRRRISLVDFERYSHAVSKCLFGTVLHLLWHAPIQIRKVRRGGMVVRFQMVVGLERRVYPGQASLPPVM